MNKIGERFIGAVIATSSIIVINIAYKCGRRSVGREIYKMGMEMIAEEEAKQQEEQKDND